MNVKRCKGYKGHRECAEDYPDGILPVSKFNRHAKNGFQDKCRKCENFASSSHNPRSNVISSIAYKIAGGLKTFYDLPKEGRLVIRAKATEEYNHGRTETKQPTYDNVIKYVETKSKGRKRDTKVVSYIRSVYDSCSVVGCDYPDYDVAHIHALKHGADDLPENCLALCPNHHRDLDRGRMINLQQLNVGGYIYFGEEDDRRGIKLKHKVDSKYLDQCNIELENWKNAS